MLDLALRSSAILALAWLLTHLFARASAATRHLIWHAAVVAVLLAPLVAPLTPRFAVPALSVSVTPAMQQVSRDVLDTVSKADDTTAALAAYSRSPATVDRASALRAAWMTGSLLCAVWFGAGWWTARRLAQRSRPAPMEWHQDVIELAPILQLERPVRLRVSADLSGPVVVGPIRGTILFPDAARTWDAQRRRSVLLHELAHIRRRDLAAHAVAQLTCVLYWFNPLAWVALRHLRAERERACDDAVLHTGTSPSAYATHLLDMARELRPRLRPTAALAMSRPVELEGRLLAVLAPNRARTPARGSRWAIAGTFAIATAAVLGATSSTPAPRVAQRSPVATARVTEKVVRAPLIDQEPDRAAASADLKRAATTLQGSTDPHQREAAALRLAASGDSASVAPLHAALADSSQDVREKAALGLGLLSSADVIPGLLVALTDPDAQVREKAAIGLAFRRDSRVTDALVTAASDRDAQVREKVAIALGTSGDQRAAAALQRLMNDRDPQVREKAVTAITLLESSPDPEAAESFRRGVRSLAGALLSLVRDR